MVSNIILIMFGSFQMLVKCHDFDRLISCKSMHGNNADNGNKDNNGNNGNNVAENKMRQTSVDQILGPLVLCRGALNI